MLLLCHINHVDAYTQSSVQLSVKQFCECAQHKHSKRLFYADPWQVYRL